MPEQKIRVLIVDDIAETRENIKRTLQFDTAIEVIGQGRNGREAVELCAQLLPDVIIMDINMPDMDGITATEKAREKVPYVQVVILSVQSDASYMRRAMLVGARDFLTKPPPIDELLAAVHRAADKAAEERTKVTQQAAAAVAAATPTPKKAALTTTGKLIVIYSPKGGTGRTTLATNLSVLLKNQDTKICLVDASLQFGDVATCLNEQVRTSIMDLIPRVDEIETDPELILNVMIKHASGIHILAAPQHVSDSLSVTPEKFSKLLDILRQQYTHIIVDTSAYLSDPVQIALEKADVIILVTTQDFPAIKNSNAFFMLVDQLKISRERVLFIMNRVDKRNRITPELVSERMRQPVALAIPSDEIVVTMSLNSGVPFVLDKDNKNSAIAKSIAALAELAREKLAKLDDFETEVVIKK
jgi:pilus assembly protein CpaE